MADKADERCVSAGVLYVVATPIGNLSDLSARAAEILKDVDLIAAEDTRRVAKILSHLGIHKPTASFHAYSSPKRLAQIIEKLSSGYKIALVSDAGTPCISDPGAELIAEAWRIGARVVVVPGPSALLAALSASGFPASRFFFAGYLPRQKSQRRKMLSTFLSQPWPVVIFEAPGRTAKLLEDIQAIAGPNRPVLVARELTKLHEQLIRGPVEKVKEQWERADHRGEVTVVVGPAEAQPETAPTAVELAQWLADEGLPPSRIASALTRLYELERKEAYRLARAITSESSKEDGGGKA